MPTLAEADSGLLAHLAPLTAEQFRQLRASGILPADAPVRLVHGLLQRGDEPLPVDEIREEHLWRFTIEQHHALIEAVVLPEGAPIELLDGLLVRKDRRDDAGDIMTVGPRHAGTTKLLVKLLNQAIRRAPVYVQSQLPITLPDNSEPEPDVAVIAGDELDDADRHPSPPTILLVIEVADASLLWDRTRKLEVYAGANIPEYWVVNLERAVVEVFREPDPAGRIYRQQTQVDATGEIHLTLAGRELCLHAADFLR